MPRYARLAEFAEVRFKRGPVTVSDWPLTQLPVSRAVTTADRGLIVDVHDVPQPGYDVAFFHAETRTVDLRTLSKDEIELWD